MKKIFVYEEFSSNRNMPRNIVDGDIFLFQNELKKSFNQTYALLVKNITLFGLNLNKFNNIFSFTKFTKMKEYKFINKIKLFLKECLKNKPNNKFKQKIDRGSWIIDEKSFHYFHWICDSLPRMIQIRNYTDSYPVLIPDSFMKYDYIMSSLNKLKINYLIYEHDQKYKINELLISSHVADSGNYKKENITELAKSFKTEQNMKNLKKIWVSREKSKHRKIVNEVNIKDILLKYNYEIFYPEDHDYLDQISLFSNAKVVAGLHGGGLTNIIYAPRDTILLEVRRESDDLNNCYFTLASELDMKYFYLNAKRLGDDLYIDNVELNIENLVKVLDLIENEIN